ncbi:hypothetical protein GCM10008938_13870 [Deinococcus roseus]|uniref:HTH marR-type domain-containing protein n=2 Tax=Deinococcus roseus TaxID=392414 RepID=A0ABQ2CWV6_9DEIO|nr:hypothetical protein GCM10008938_13870 [Deinococcus roseus]
MGNRLNQRLEQVHNLQLKDLLIAREIHQGARYPSEIAEMLRIPRDMVSRSIERLLQAGTISREIDPHDSRRTILSINPEGEARRKEVQQTIQSTMEPIVGSLTPEELSTLIGFLRKMVEHAYQKEQKEKENA